MKVAFKLCLIIPIITNQKCSLKFYQVVYITYGCLPEFILVTTHETKSLCFKMAICRNDDYFMQRINKESMVEVMTQFCASSLDENRYIGDNETTSINKINRTNAVF